MSDRLTQNFHLAELQCNDGTPVPEEFHANALAICERAQALRDIVGPLKVVSGYRTPAWNSRVGGARKSQHLTASALDLRSALHPSSTLHALYLDLIRKGEVPDGGLGFYPTFIHIDVGRPRRWTVK